MANPLEVEVVRPTTSVGPGAPKAEVTPTSPVVVAKRPVVGVEQPTVEAPVTGVKSATPAAQEQAPVK